MKKQAGLWMYPIPCSAASPEYVACVENLVGKVLSMILHAGYRLLGNQ